MGFYSMCASVLEAARTTKSNHSTKLHAWPARTRRVRLEECSPVPGRHPVHSQHELHERHGGRRARSSVVVRQACLRCTGTREGPIVFQRRSS
jgi:hypothetical protein